MKIIETFRHWNSRLAVFYIAYALLFSVLGGGLTYRQLILHDSYKKKEEFQNQRRVLYPGPRGKIYDRNGNLLVGNRPRFESVVYLNELKSEIRKERIQLSKELKVTHAHLTSKERFEKTLWDSRLIVLQRYLNQINDILDTQKVIKLKTLKAHYGYRLLMPFPLMSDLSHNQYAQLIEQLPIGSPISIYTDTAREYPYGPLAAHTLGYVVTNPQISEEGVPGSGLRTFSYKGKMGKTGLEHQFEETLQGISGGEVWLVDPLQYQHEQVAGKSKVPQPGKDVHTSIDINLQKIAEDAIGEKTGAAILVEVETGEILVLASKPSFDLNALSPFIPTDVMNDINERGAFVNRATQGLYPPGSTFKIITSIAAMRNGLLAHDEVIQCGTHYRVGNRLFPEHSNASFNDVDLARSLEVSSNVFMYQIGLRIGINAIAQEARRFGLHLPTHLELPYETKRMLIPDPQWKEAKRGYPWTDGDTANVSIGQGALLVTPLQMAAFAASLARGETRTQLTLLHDPTRTEHDHGGEPIGLNHEQHQAILNGLERVVSLTGTGRFAKVKDVRVAGKTGTAQVRPNGKPLTLAWFLGFAPVEAPKVAVIVMIEGTEIGDDYAGGKTAAPITRKILEGYFHGTSADGNSLAINQN